jgi:alanine-glyoxylate transaminase/serine-glyoxylate transaminase/serine-pyruvate transaminase
VFRSGRHFLQRPGPSNVPDRVLRAMDRNVIDHRGPDFPKLTAEVLAGLGAVFGTNGDVFIYPSSGSGGWEAALVNTLSPGDRVLSFDNGFFGNGWAGVAERLGLDVQVAEGDWRRGVDADAVAAELVADHDRRIRAVLIVHNETSTGVTTDLASIRAAINGTGHDALFLVDAVSSLGCTAYEHDEWGIDVSISGSQKGMMLPPGLGFHAVSAKAREVSASARLPRAYWDWDSMATFNETGYFPYTPATNLLFGLREALVMIIEETQPERYARHARLATATRAAVNAWGLENVASREREFSSSVTSIFAPDGKDADDIRNVILDNFDMSLGAGLGKLKGRAFRIGHLGDLNELTLMGALAGVEMGLQLCGITAKGGVEAAMSTLTENK